jgi:hypothetical protein
MTPKPPITYHRRVELTPAEQRQAIIEWATQKKPIRVIAEQFNMSPARVQRIIDRLKDEFLIDVDVKKRFLLEQLAEISAMRRKLWEIARSDHWLVSQGRIVAKRVSVDDESGIEVWEDLPDAAPVLMAFDRLIKLQEREAKLLGLDAAEKLDVSAYVTYAVEGIDMTTLQ